VAILEPWVLLRLLAGLVAVALFTRASVTAARVLRYFDLSRATEGQLALERRMELARTFVRVGAVTQVASLALTMLAADKLSRGVRGAMCAYGVFHANEWGFRALGASIVAAVGAGVLLQLFALDARVRGMDLVRPLAIAILVVTPLVVADFALTARFLLGLDLGVVASCCSGQLDPIATAATGYAQGPRLFATVGAVSGISAAIAVAVLAARRARAPWIVLSGAVTALALPFALAASVLEVAPHAFEAPHHTCPFCLLHADVFGIGYWLFGAMFLASVWGMGSAVGALMSRGAAARKALSDFAPRALRNQAIAWAFVLALGAAPVVRYAMIAHGAQLFP
jgi:hypothetical protein